MVIEAAVTGLVASLLGLLGGVALAIVLQSLMAALGFGETDVTPVVSPRTIVVSLVVGVLVSVLCALAPAWRASRVAPLAAVIVTPVLLMLAMVPAVYEPLDERAGLHFLYHVGVAVLGVCAGLGAGSLGRVTGRVALVLGVSMMLMFAAGAGGG